MTPAEAAHQAAMTTDPGAAAIVADALLTIRDEADREAD